MIDQKNIINQELKSQFSDFSKNLAECYHWLHSQISIIKQLGTRDNAYPLDDHKPYD